MRRRPLFVSAFVLGKRGARPVPPVGTAVGMTDELLEDADFSDEDEAVDAAFPDAGASESPSFEAGRLRLGIFTGVLTILRRAVVGTTSTRLGLFFLLP